MSRLIETICLLDGQFKNLGYHEQRMASSLEQLYKAKEKINLSEYLNSFDYPKIGLHKCRILYDHHSKVVEFLPYILKPITSLKVVVDDTILYDHKYADRSRINQLMGNKGQCDDIIIVKKGWVTDASYANIVFKRDGGWYTPQRCLLKGTMREGLLQSGTIIEQEIRASDIVNFQKFKLINAMLGFDGQECDISGIY